jgi:hypothetical protein
MQLMWKIEAETDATRCDDPIATRPQVLNANGYTMLLSEDSSPSAARTALKSLRGFRATGRRIVWCNSDQLQEAPNSDMESWGRRFAESAAASVVVISGAGAREAAVGAREAGLPLGRVIVCPDAATARNVVCDLVGPGDTLLALGWEVEDCRRLIDRLDARSETGNYYVGAVA